MKHEQTGAGIAEPADDIARGSVAAGGNGAAGRGRGAQDDARAGEEKKEAGSSRTALREYFESLLVTAVMALFGMTFVVQAVKVPTGSMQNTILIGDQLLVNKFIFAPGPPLKFLPQRDIRRGDVIVFKYPGNPHNPERDRTEPTSQPYATNFVKRVVGMPGERVLVQGERVYINGKLLPERRVTAENPPQGDNVRTSGVENDAPLTLLNDPPPTGEGPYTAFYDADTRSAPNEGRGYIASPSFHYAVNGKEAVVPANSYFVMGDNRENSEDSRAWGFVPRELVVGRAMFVYWSYDNSAPKSGNFLIDFYENSRWGRTGTLVK